MTVDEGVDSVERFYATLETIEGWYVDESGGIRRRLCGSPTAEVAFLGDEENMAFPPSQVETGRLLGIPFEELNHILIAETIENPFHPKAQAHRRRLLKACRLEEVKS